MASTSVPAVDVHGPWYMTMESKFDEEGARRLVRTYVIPDDHEIVVADPTDRPHDPPIDTVCFFLDQFQGGLRLSLIHI